MLIIRVYKNMYVVDKKKHKNKRQENKLNTKMDDGKQMDWKWTESLKERDVIKEWVFIMGPQHL